MSRNKTEGRYKGWKYGKHFRSKNKLVGAIAEEYGNPLYSGQPKLIK
jgi:hypothetical protein